MAKKKAWDFLKKQKPQDTLQYRDVYEDQQFERTRIDKKMSMTSRNIVAFILAIIIGLVIYVIGAFFLYSIQNLKGAGKSASETQGSTEITKDLPEGFKKVVTENGIRYDNTLAKEGEKTRYTYEEFQDYKDAHTTVTKKDGTKVESTALKDLKQNMGKILAPNFVKVAIGLCGFFLSYLMIYYFLKRDLDIQNVQNDTSDINQYQNDQHIALPEEVLQGEFDIFPDVGAHSSVRPNALISHVMAMNKGIRKIEVAKRYKEDVKDEHGNILFYKGEVIETEDGNMILEQVPMFDEKFADHLFSMSESPKDKIYRKYYDLTKLDYNRENKYFEKMKGIDTVRDLVNQDWSFPVYEKQRPAGFYVVDQQPTNTMVLAITRAGKGQTYIEPLLDMWSREDEKRNVVVNDPKGELLRKFYVPYTMRGFQPIQFNLINPMKTDIYNPLGLAADAAREGDFAKTAQYVKDIAGVFFPADQGEDPVWNNSANNAFQRAAYGLIDYYLEEEFELRKFAMETDMDDTILDFKLDTMWGKVTLYNCYQLFTQLSSKRLKNPVIEFRNDYKAGKLNNLSDDEYQTMLLDVQLKAELWEDKPELDLLSLYFNATERLPKNSMRRLISDANNSLRAIGGAEKMLSSIYGIAITAMVRHVHM